MRRSTRTGSGFTLLELIIVISIIGILATIAMPALRNVPRRASEAVLKHDLKTLRELIDRFRTDKGYYPTSFDELVEEEYLREIPRDPITKSSETWVADYEEFDPDNPPLEVDQEEEGLPGIIDVHSGSKELSLDGEPYNTW